MSRKLNDNVTYERTIECKLCGERFSSYYDDRLIFNNLWHRQKFMERQRRFLQHLNKEHGGNWTILKGINKVAFAWGAFKDLVKDILWLMILPIALTGIILQWVAEKIGEGLN